MSKIDELKADIEKLPSEEVAELFRWLSEKEWESWDKGPKPTLRLEGSISWCERPRRRRLKGPSRKYKCAAPPLAFGVCLRACRNPSSEWPTKISSS
jgi:hypothetical protein